MSTISASTTSTTAYKVTADTTGTLVFQTGASPTTALTLNSSQSAAFAGDVSTTGTNGFLSTAGGKSTYFYADATGGNITVPGSNAFRIYTASAERMRIDSSGNVGIGNTAPGSYGQLVVGNTSAAAQTIQTLTANTTFSILTSATAAGGTTISNSWVSGGQGPLIFKQSSTEAMRILEGSQFCVGTTGVVVGSSSYINTICNGGTQYGITIKNISGSVSNALNFYNSSNSQVGRVELGTSTTTYATSSDYRLKDNVFPMSGALVKVMQLKPCTYTWKIDGSVGQGFIAHELQEIVPDAVSGEKDAVHEDGSIKPQGIDTSFLVATLTAAIQELKAIVDAQRVELDAAKADIATLKGAA